MKNKHYNKSFQNIAHTKLDHMSIVYVVNTAMINLNKLNGFVFKL